MQQNNIKTAVVMLCMNFRIGQKDLNGIYNSGRDIRFFIGDIPPVNLFYNKDFEYLITKDILFKHGVEKITLETIREFAYLTKGYMEFMIISEGGEIEAFRIGGGKLRRLEITSKCRGRVEETVFL